MAISRPATKTKISTSEWGFPVTDEVNRLTTWQLAQVPTAWVAPTLTGGWVNAGGAWQVVQYRKVGDMVQIRGAVKSGAFFSQAFLLPVGFRPPADLDFNAYSDNGSAIYISAFTVVVGGSVTPNWGAPAPLSRFSLQCSFSVSA